MLGRVRLTMTLTNVAVVAVVIVALLLAAFFVARRVINQNADRELITAAESFQRGQGRNGLAEITGPGPIAVPFTGGRFELGPRIDFRQFARRDPPLELAIFDTRGDVVAQLSDLPSPLPSMNEVQKALGGNQQIATVRGEAGSLRVVTQPIVDSNGAVVAVVQVAESRAAQDQIVATLRNVLVAVGGAGLVFAGVAGYLLTGRTMRPVDLAFERQKAFVADAAHELRTPLAIISANAEALEMASADMPAADRDLLSGIRHESGYLAALISKLLEMARLDYEQRQVKPEVVDLAVVVSDACEAVSPLAATNGVTIDWSRAAEPLNVSGDGVLIRLIVLSLLDNAIKYGPEGGTVTVELDGSGPLASVRVRDAGPGIPPEHLERVFDRFYRVDKARSRRTGSAGLGLAIAKRAAEVINGQLSLSSDQETGTVAMVRFQRSAD